MNIEANCKEVTGGTDECGDVKINLRWCKEHIKRVDSCRIVETNGKESSCMDDLENPDFWYSISGSPYWGNNKYTKDIRAYFNWYH